jgi:hypothetical protein
MCRTPIRPVKTKKGGNAFRATREQPLSRTSITIIALYGLNVKGILEREGRKGVIPLKEGKKGGSRRLQPAKFIVQRQARTSIGHHVEQYKYL